MAQAPIAMEHMQWPFLVGAVLISATVLTAVTKIGRVVSSVVAPVRQFMSEHDVLWEDYNIRTGGTYRRATGRGAPPDPEEFYRNHPPADGGD